MNQVERSIEIMLFARAIKIVKSEMNLHLYQSAFCGTQGMKLKK
jgi:hypothetical protein